MEASLGDHALPPASTSTPPAFSQEVPDPAESGGLGAQCGTRFTAECGSARGLFLGAGQGVRGSRRRDTRRLLIRQPSEVRRSTSSKVPLPTEPSR